MKEVQARAITKVCRREDFPSEMCWFYFLEVLKINYIMTGVFVNLCYWQINLFFSAN